MMALLFVNGAVAWSDARLKTGRAPDGGGHDFAQDLEEEQLTE
jgi:hypothetical protein